MSPMTTRSPPGAIARTSTLSGRGELDIIEEPIEQTRQRKNNRTEIDPNEESKRQDMSSPKAAIIAAD